MSKISRLNQIGNVYLDWGRKSTVNKKSGKVNAISGWKSVHALLSILKAIELPVRLRVLSKQIEIADFSRLS